MEMLTIEDFAPHMGKIYRVPLADGSSLKLRLIEQELRPFRPTPKYLSKTAPFRNQPFSLVFQGPPDIRLADDTVQIQDENGQMLFIALSAFAGNEEGIYYQAVFN